jgi:hypothetical protein
MREFRTDLTTHYDDYDLLCSYDKGRDMAHRITFRRWDHNYESNEGCGKWGCRDCYPDVE